MAQIVVFLSVDVFKIKYCATIARWCLEFYNENGDVPGLHIEDVFERKRDDLPEEIATLIETFLAELSERYERNPQLNINYLVDQARMYCRKRRLENFHNSSIDAIRGGRVEDAERALQEFRTIGLASNRSYNPFTKEEVRDAFAESNANIMFTMPQAVGRMVGRVQRGWLGAFLGPMKRGKTFFLAETAFASAAEKYNTLFVSLEMNRTDINTRVFRRMLNRPDENGPLDLPCFDCLHNQDNSCRLRQRVVRNQTVLDDEGELIKYKRSSSYKPCTICLENEETEENYYPSVWQHTVDMQKFTKTALFKKIKGFKRMYGDRLRVCCFPAFSATVHDVEAEIEYLDILENFKIDTLVVDYADIINPGRQNLSERGSLDHIWKQLKRLAAERNIFVATASQTNRQAILRESIRDVDTAEDIRKMAHVDLTMGLNQTIDDKEVGLMRVNCINHRHRMVRPRAEAYLLQSLDIGLPILDSYLFVP